MKKCMKKILMANIAAAIICSTGGVTSAQDSLYEYGMTPVSIENGKLVSGDAIHNDAATADIQTSNMTGTTDQYYGHFFFGNADIKNTSFDNNTLKTDGPNGVVYFNSSVKLYPTSYEVETPNTVTVTNSSFNGNKIESTGGTASIYSTSKAGAVMIKGTDVTFNDVAFNDNKASGGDHAQAMGGAVYLDSTSNTANHDGKKRVLKASATFNVTKDTTYAGNTVSGVGDYSDTYGSYAKTGGGFMYMDRGGEGNFNIADGATLKIGKDGETDANTDSIASAIRGSNAAYGENTINKEGLGTLTVNGSMSGYHGDLNVKEGTMNINQTIAGDAKISVSDGATLHLKGVELSSQSGTISVADSKGNMSSVTLPERDGTLVAETGSKVTADTITLKDKSSMKVETGATLQAQSVSVKDDATLKTESNSTFDVDQVAVDPAKEGHVQLMGDFSGKLVDSNGQALTAEQTKNVMKKADGDNSRVDITAQDGKSATSLLQGNDGTFTIQRKDYENGGQTTVLASYSKDGTYDAKGHDMKNIGQLSAKSLSVGQITDVETAINKNKADIGVLDDRVTTNENMIKQNTDAINILDEQNKAEIGRLDGLIDTNAKGIEQNKADIGVLDDRVTTNADMIKQNTDAINSLDEQNKAEIGRLDGRINTNETKIEQNTADIKSLDEQNKAEIGRLDDLIGTNETKIEQNTADIKSLDEQNKAEIGRLDGRIDTNATNIAQNTTDIRSAETAIKTNANGIAQNKADIQRLDGRVNKVGANAAALAALHPLDYDASDKWSVAAGVGNYGDANAMAIGAFYRPNEDVMLNMAGSFGSGENMVNAGISFKVGQRGMKAAKAEGADVKALQEKVEAQDKEIKELREMVEKLVAKA